MRKIKPVQRLPNCYQIKRMRRQPRRLCRATNTAKPGILRDQRFASHPHFLIGLNRNHFEAASQKYFRKQPRPRRNISNRGIRRQSALRFKQRNHRIGILRPELTIALNAPHKPS